MRLLHTHIHPEICDLNGLRLNRTATRGIILQGDNLLLLYTQRYDDYSLPGGGVDEGENLIEGLIREVREETGATGLHGIQPFGIYEEFRPWHKDGFDHLHMHSHCYICQTDTPLGETSLEDYERNNGMEAKWVNIYEAITHNERTLANSPKSGLSIQRELFLLKLIAKELVESSVLTSTA